MRDMIVACLRPESTLSFTHGASGLEAIEKLSLTPFDLVILDLNMPDIGGIEVVELPNVIERMIREGRKTGVTENGILLRKESGEVPIEDSVAAIGGDFAMGAVVIFRDVTRRKQSELAAKDRSDFERSLSAL